MEVSGSIVVQALLLLLMSEAERAGSAWCVARSDATQQALQSALDYACNSGLADCAPIEPSGLCFLPNTVQAHASYAFNSYFQRKGNAAGSCSFAGTASIATTDPSYGSCDYPASPSTAGVSATPAPPPPPPPAGLGGVPVFGGMASAAIEASHCLIRLHLINIILWLIVFSYFMH
ncbi:hypothetical protein M569_16973 [Genlisea aurea]|uniref:X8 domain-containing protein n=1 Tax=Genlisea aurea TaxID=192259 RepID=S8BU31_9LAMI|nr:hypothetical protein M569_16973 [Genlisea aurea]